MITWDNGTSTNASPTPGSYLSDWTTLTKNTTTANSNLGAKLIREQIRYLATKYYFNEKSYTTTSVAQQQGYVLPSDFEVMENVTVTVGGYIWSGTPTADRGMWDRINLVPYYSDFVQYTFIWQGQLLLWPIPASASNTITMNYKSRVVDPSQADVTSGTVSITTNTTTLTHSGTSFASWMAQSGWVKIAHSTTTTATNGDNRWYQISSVTSTSSLDLINNYLGTTVAGGTFVIGDVPILPEDYQDIPLHQALAIYYTSIVPDVNQAGLYTSLANTKLVDLDKKYGSKDYSPALTDTQAQVFNPNLFPRQLS